MKYTQLKMLLWVLFCIAPALSIAGTHVADIGLQTTAKNFSSEPAKPIPVVYEDDDDDC